MEKCIPQYLGKSRNGAPRYWCTVHHAPISDGKGRLLDRCLAGEKPPLAPEDCLTLRAGEYPMGFALQALLPPVYSTGSLIFQSGLQVRIPGETPDFRHVFQLVRIQKGAQTYSLDSLSAVSYLISRLLGHLPEYLICPHCGAPHLDTGWFAAVPHKKHLCLHCGRDFRQKFPNIGNPVVKIRETLSGSAPCPEMPNRPKAPSRLLKISSRDYPLGFTLFAPCPPVLETYPAEEAAFCLCACTSPTERAVFQAGAVEIDGVPLDAAMAQIYTAQLALPHLAGRITALVCPRCGAPHLDTGPDSYLPHTQHLCQSCGQVIRTRTKTVSNPIASNRL